MNFVIPVFNSCIQSAHRQAASLFSVSLRCFFRYFQGAQLAHHLAELFEGGSEVIGDSFRETIGIREIVRFLQVFVSEPEDIEAGFIAVMSSSLLWTFHQQRLRKLVCIVARPDPRSCQVLS